jgi:sec-independent protein translocase protein TatA
MFGLGIQELLIILVIILIFFGAEKIPQLAKSLGKGMSEFRKASREVKEEIDKEADATSPVAAMSENTVVTVGYVVCPACNGKTASGSIFCSQCGQRLSSEERCKVCSRLLQPEEKFCPNCGNSHEGQ